MQINTKTLAQKAIQSALKGNWEEAIKLNKKILEKDPNNLDAKLRLGHALTQINETKKAIKLFKEILKQDPVNSIAKKKLEQLLNNKVQDKVANLNPTDLIIEPGTTQEITIGLDKGIKHTSISIGEELYLNILKTKINVVKGDKTIAKIEDKDIVSRLNSAKKDQVSISTKVIKIKERNITLLIKASQPIFKARKQDIRPYLNQEPEDDMPSPTASFDDDEE